jgi:hypothetical protein
MYYTNEQSASDILVPIYMHTNYPIDFNQNKLETSLQTNNPIQLEQQDIIEPIINQQLTTEEKKKINLCLSNLWSFSPLF